MLLDYSDLKNRLAVLQAQNDSGKNKRVEKAKNEFRFFVENYLPHYLDHNKKETSSFRKEFYKDIKEFEKNRINEFLAFRGSAKTTMGSRALCMWRSIRKIHKYAIQVSDGAELATENLEAIQLEFEENKRLKADFLIQKGWVWKAKVFIVNIEGHFIKYQAFGSGTRIRGKNFMGSRPDDIYCDDLENDVNIENPDQRDKLYKWIIKVLFKLSNRNKPYNIWFLGTVLHYDSPLMRLSQRVDVSTHIYPGIITFPKNIDLWEKLYGIAKNSDIKKAYSFYLENIELLQEGLKVDDTSWLSLGIDMDYPVIFSLMLDYFEDPKAFNEEIQMSSHDEASQIFKMQYYSYLPADLVYYMGVDSALGKTKGDFAAITILGFSPSLNKYFIVDGFIARIHPDEVTIRMLKYAQTYYLQNIGFEIVQFQEYYKDTVQKKAIKEKIHFPVTPLANSEAGKALRIESIAPNVNDGTILFNPNMKAYNEQYIKYPKAKHDDAPDSGEMAYRVARYKTANFKDVKKVQQSLKNKFNYLKKRY
ncbi:phage terminase large subunit [Aliarcobacter vitoriensis]|uniref:Uncharacterized protein n=1 Tax=Aliarcobacter vitoriensis TaxID=2011099 RepID=A0A366MS24_9BACT|nr:phage terminase large subunit [Aliarcobacter vitoriensis]RBQ28404.1 hypothetical protein CRU91_09290 [Aliarcobacter vitoriensis]